MKRLTAAIFSSLFLVSFAPAALAEEAPPAEPAPDTETAPEEGACKKLADACKAAGYQAGQHKATGKGLHVDCMKKLLAGQTVEGVTVDAADVAACKVQKPQKLLPKPAKKLLKKGLN